MNCKKIIVFLFLIFSVLLEGTEWKIFYSKNATGPEKHAAMEIADHLSKVCGQKISWSDAI